MAAPKVEKSRKTGGRTKGTPNKKTQEVIDRLEALNCDPIEGMARIAMNDVPCESCEATGVIKIEEGEEICPACNGAKKLFVSVELRGQMYKELAQYVAPKRKAIEVTGADGEDLQIQTQVTFVGVSTKDGE